MPCGRRSWLARSSTPPAAPATCCAFYRDFIDGAPDELSVYVNLRTAPALEWMPADLHGKPVVMLVPCYLGDPDEGERLMRPLRDFGPPAADLVQGKPYLAHQAMF